MGDAVFTIRVLAKPISATLLVLAASLATVRAPSAAVIIDFDSSDPQLPGASYADQGILFGDGFYTSAQNYLGAVGIPSAPNYLAVAGVATQAVITFVDPADPGRKATTDFFGFDNAGLTDANPTGLFDGLKIVLLDLAGLEIGSTIIDPIGPAASATRDIFQTTFAVAGIHQVLFAKLTNSAGNGALSPIDNVTFNAVTPVPAPSSLALFGTGLVALGFGRVHRARPRSSDRAPTQT
jgi:hypothetical protein